MPMIRPARRYAGSATPCHDAVCVQPSALVVILSRARRLKRLPPRGARAYLRVDATRQRDAGIAAAAAAVAAGEARAVGGAPQSAARACRRAEVAQQREDAYDMFVATPPLDMLRNRRPMPFVRRRVSRAPSADAHAAAPYARDVIEVKVFSLAFSRSFRSFFLSR